MHLTKKLATLLLLITVVALSTNAQHKVIRGVLLDKQSDEPLPFASAIFRKSGMGVLTDSAGRFIFSLHNWPEGDTLELSNVGYKPTLIPIPPNQNDTLNITVYIEVLPPKNETIVKVKYNRALWFWRRIISHKDKNDRRELKNFSYEVYNKLELDLNNVNRDKLEKNLILKPLNFILDYTDTSTEKDPFLPVYLTETISDYYIQRQPLRTREVIKATNARGFTNESWMKQLGATYQNVNVYDNTVPVFDKQFISPVADNGDNFYNFKLLDTQYLGGRRLVHLSFTPKRTGENTFVGDCWVNDTTYAIQKITMRPSKDVNVNFVTGLTLIQEFKLINDTMWFLYKDKFIVDLAPMGQNKLGAKGRKTTTYRNVVIDSDSVLAQLNKSKPSEDIVLLPNTTNLTDSFWSKNRFEPLNQNEQHIYSMLDTLERNKVFNRYKAIADVLTTGTRDIGNFRVGPWYYWISGNAWEGTRVRFDLSTNKHFDQHWFFHVYGAYGFKDQQPKGQVEMKYRFSKTPWSYIGLSYKSDLDNGQVVYDQLSSDNLFTFFFRKDGVVYRYQQIKEKKFEYFTDTYKNFSIKLNATSRDYNPLVNLPGKENFPAKEGDPLNNFETAITLRYAFQEHLLEDNFSRTSLGSERPIIQLKYAHAFPGVLKSNYTYDRLDFTISDDVNLAPYGKLHYNLFAGKVFSKDALPYQLLIHQPGNDWHYYSNHSFNLMTRFEYLTDQYAGFSFEHNVGSGLFRYIPITRKIKLRQFWEVKGVVGNLSEANKALNFVDDAPFKSLDGKLYMEVGTGIDNIFKFFRVDFLWRVLPTPLPENKVERFGVFFGFRVSL